MATLMTEGLNEFALSIHEIAQLPSSVINEMLEKGGTVVMNAQKSACPRRTGKLASSIKLGRMFRTYDGAAIEIKPEGTHHKPKHGKAVRNAEVAFILEYGAPGRHLAARQWMQRANETAAEAATEAEKRVYDAWLSQHNL